MRIKWSLAILALAYTIYFLLACEVAVRYFQSVVPAPADSGFIPDSATGFRLRPSPSGDTPETTEYYVNASGFRDKPLPTDKPDGVFRVLALGDSHVTGDVPIDANFLQQAERYANNLAPGAEVEVIKMGCPGWQTENALGALRSPGLDLQPDLVVLCFCVGTDIAGRPVPAEVIQGNLHYVGSQIPWLNTARKSRLFVLGQQVYLWRVMAGLRNAVAQADDLVGMFAHHESTPPAEAEPRLAAEAESNLQISREYARVVERTLPMLETTPPSWLDRQWDEGLSELAEFDVTCRDAGLPWVLLVVPTEIQIDPEVREVVLGSLERSQAGLDFDLPQHRIDQWAAENGVTVLDPTETLRTATDQDGHQYLSNNPHWNEAGSQVVGGLLAETIARRIQDL